MVYPCHSVHPGRAAPPLLPSSEGSAIVMAVFRDVLKELFLFRNGGLRSVSYEYIPL